MDKFKGTKLEWKLEIGDNRAWINDGDHKSMCVVFGSDFNVPNHEMKYNAKLILCAPKMLCLLKQLLDSGDEMFSHGEPSETYFQLLNDAQQLIKKATE